MRTVLNTEPKLLFQSDFSILDTCARTHLSVYIK
jgi:hypothetical protein